MRKLLMAAVFVVIFGARGVGQDATGNGNLTANGQAVTLNLNATGGAVVQITGTWTATVTFEATVNGTTWFTPPNIYEITDPNTAVTSTTVNGVFIWPVGGYRTIRTRTTAFIGGTVEVAIRATVATVDQVVFAKQTGTWSGVEANIFTSVGGTIDQFTATVDDPPPDTLAFVGGYSDGSNTIRPLKVDGQDNLKVNIAVPTTLPVNLTSIEGNSPITDEASPSSNEWGLFTRPIPRRFSTTGVFQTGTANESIVLNMDAANFVTVTTHTLPQPTSGIVEFQASWDGGTTYISGIVCQDSGNANAITSLNKGQWNFASSSMYPFFCNVSGATHFRLFEVTNPSANTTFILTAYDNTNGAGLNTMAVGAAITHVGGTGVAVNNGAVDNGTQRVTLANNSTGILASVGTIATSVTPGTGAAHLGKAEDAAHTSADVGVAALGVVREAAATQFIGADNRYGNPTIDRYGVQSVSGRHPNAVQCNISSTATTSTTVTGCTAPGANLSIYITSLQWSSSIISTTTNFMTIQDGTGGNCAAAVTVHYRGYIPAAFNSVNVVFNTPIKVDANSEICLLHPGAGTKLVGIQGFIAP